MRKILAIDDIRNNLRLIKSILAKKIPDSVIILASSGADGIQKAIDEKPDTILLDVYMPEMDGFEVCSYLKNNDQTKCIPILLVSAFGDDSNIRIKGLNAGADGFITKPYHMAELVALTNVMLRIKSAEDLLRTKNKDLEVNILRLKDAEKIQKKSYKQIKKYQKNLKRLNIELTLAEEKEKKLIAGYLHDGIGQTLSIANIKLTSLLNKNIEEQTKKSISEISQLIDSAITDSRLLTYDLSPPILYELGLIEAIKWKLNKLNEKANIAISYESDINEIKVDANNSIIIDIIIRQLFLNILKHAKANLIFVKITIVRKNYYISIVDDGIGFDFMVDSKLNKTKGFGLFSINERINSINARFNIKSNRGKGTIATIVIPIKK